jgi:hypothetical protein
MDKHLREVDFPVVPAGKDVVRQHFAVTADGNEVKRESFDLLVAKAQYEVPEGSSVVLSMVHEDNAGNMSPAQTQSFVSVDTLPPDAPGPFGEDRLISETTVPDA